MTTPEIPYTKSRISYGAYSIALGRKNVKVEEFDANNEVAVLRENGQAVRTFDAIRHPLGAFTRFALVSLLGNRDSELVVEQTGPRSWAVWVATLKPNFRMLFTSYHYPVDHEVGIEDLDGDGVPELVMTLNTFWFFDGLCGACSPRFDIAFKYDKKRGSFRPANHLVKGLCDTTDELAEAEEKIKLWQSENLDINSDPLKASELYSRVLIHALPLLYCGNESLGWSFFDRLYNLPDRETRKSRIKRTLRSDRVYQFIQNDLKRTRRKPPVHRAGLPG